MSLVGVCDAIEKRLANAPRLRMNQLELETEKTIVRMPEQSTPAFPAELTDNRRIEGFPEPEPAPEPEPGFRPRLTRSGHVFRVKVPEDA